MAYVPVPKDMSKVKNKIALGLTKRQLIGISCAAALGLPAFFLLRNISMDIAMFAILIVGFPALFISMYERDGMPAEEWIKNWLKFKYLNQAKRRYIKPSLLKKDVESRIKEIERLKKIDLKANSDNASDSYFKAKKIRNENLFTIISGCISKIIKQLKKEHIPKISTQDTIKYKEMYKNGMCRIDNDHYSKTILFEDINYQLAQDDEKNFIFTNYCSFLNSFDESISIQFTFVNYVLPAGSKTSIKIELQNDGFDYIREEYQEMLEEQIEKGNNGLVRKKYITFTIKAKNPKEALRRLLRIESDAISKLASLSAQPVRSFPVSGKERLEIFHNILNSREKKFNFSWDKCQGLGLKTQDFIAPRKMEFSDKRHLKTGNKYIKTQQFILNASELSDAALADFLDMETEMIVNLHIQPIDRQKAIKKVKGIISDIGKMKAEEQKKALRNGYGLEILPPDLTTYEEVSQDVLMQLETKDENWFSLTVFITNIAETMSKLENDSLQARSIASLHNCELKPYDFNQENCLLSIMPLGVNYTYPRRGVTTSAAAGFIPFTTQELLMEGKSLYYGLNALSNNIIMADRKKLHNPNGLILGTPGSGKSFAAKREMANNFLLTDDNIMICDPEAEYFPLVQHLGGQVVNISASSKDFINPLDINLDYSDDDNPLALKSDFIISMMELICGGKTGLQPNQISIIDQCVRKIYEKYLDEPIEENIPILEDFYNELIKIHSPESKYLSDSLEIYVHGSQKIFNNRTNVDVKNRLVCYNIKNLGKSLRKLGMLIIQDQVWNKVSQNRNLGKSTWYYIDELHLLLKDEQTAAYTIETWKRFRKWGGIPTGITQNVKDLLHSQEIESIFDNTDFYYLLKQATGDRMILAEKLGFSDGQQKHIDNSEKGHGLLKYGAVTLPFKDDFPKDTYLYKAMTTNPEEVAKMSDSA